MGLTLGSAVRELRHSAGLSQRELAELVGIQHTYLSHIEANRREPTLRVLRQIAAALRLPPSLLISVALMVDLPEADRAVYELVLTSLLNLTQLPTDADSDED